MIEYNAVIAKACDSRRQVKNWVKKIPIVFNFSSERKELKEISKEILNNSGIRVLNESKLQKSNNNILIHPSGNKRFSKEIFCDDKENVIHFNNKVSNM